MELPATLFSSQLELPAGIVFRLVGAEDEWPLHTTCYSHQAAHQFHDFFQHMLRRQKQRRCYWLLIEMDDVVIGNGQLIIHRYTAECANLFVVPAYRSQGIGSGLIGVLTAVARHHGLANLEIGVTLDNPRALALYQRLGFTEDRHVQFPHSKPSIILHKVI